MGTYRTAQVCKSGHVITSNIHNAAHLSNFCPECRAETITSCPNCNTPIHGEYDVPSVISISTYTPPKYYHHCGYPFPWTEEKINSISKLLDMQDQLTEEEKNFLCPTYQLFFLKLLNQRYPLYN